MGLQKIRHDLATEQQRQPPTLLWQPEVSADIARCPLWAQLFPRWLDLCLNLNYTMLYLTIAKDV